MLSNRPKHTEASSRVPTGADTEKPHALWNLGADQSVSANMSPTALSHSSVSLMESIVDPINIEKAWKKVRSNGGAPGPDAMTIKAFPKHFREHWPAIRQQLLEGTYQPAPARRKSISKPDGGQRDLGIPNVQERLIQQAILQILTPIFDPGFSESSFGFRPKRSAQGAAKQVQTIIRSGYRHCIDMDLAKFFDKVQHDILMVRVARKVSDKRLLRLIGNYLRAGVMVDAQLQPSIEGTMQGGPLSPILANILLDDFDKELENRGLLFVRYADDFLVFTKTSQAAVRVARSIEQYLTRKLKLVVNHQKSRICKTSEVDFLGFSFTGYSGQLRVSPKNLKKFKDRTREITRRNRGVSIKHRLLELRRYFQGWVGYFKIVPIKSFFRDLDKWARRRLRSCYWKQWRGPRTRIANLKQLGVRNREAITHGVSSKGPCCVLRKSGHVLELRSTCCTLNGLSHRTRTGQSRGDLAEAYCEEAKRLVRTRTLGVVRGVRRNPAPIPILVRPRLAVECFLCLDILSNRRWLWNRQSIFTHTV